MTQLLLIPACLAIGFGLSRFVRAPDEWSRLFSKTVIWASFPALIACQLPALLASTELSWLLAIPISMAWIQFAIAGLLFWSLGSRLQLSRTTVGCLIMTVGLGNTSFVGFPLIQALHGEAGLRVALLIDQLGTFLALSTLGLVVASSYSGRSLRFNEILRRIFLFPPFAALCLTVLAWLFVPAVLDAGFSIFKIISLTLVPFALLAVGLQLNFERSTWAKWRKPLGIGLTAKLLFVPTVFYLFYWQILEVRDLTSQVTILESAMAPMITGAIVAAEFGLEPRLASLMVSVGIPISLVSVPAWNYLFLRLT